MQISTLELFRALVENAPDPLVYLDQDFNFVYVNRAYAETCQRQAEELIGRSHFALYPSTERQELFIAVRESGKPVTQREMPLLFSNQPERGVTYWDWTMTPDRNIDGSVRGFVLSQREVTDKVAANRRIEESEKRLRILNQALPQQAWSAAKDGQSYEDLRQHEQSGERPRTGGTAEWEASIYPADRERAVTGWREAIRTGTLYQSEYRIRRAGGVYRWILVRAFPLRDANGEIERWLGACTDIQDLKDAEAAASRRAAELQTILDVAPLPIWIAHDAECRAITVNPAVARFIGSAAQSKIAPTRGGDQRMPRHFIANREVSPSELPLQRAIRLGVQIESMDLELELPDGTRKQVIGGAAPFFDADGRVCGGVAAYVDVTPLRQATLSLQKSEERYHSLFDSMTEGFALHELVFSEDGSPRDYRILDVNPAFERLTGLKRDAIRGKLLSEAVPSLEPLWLQRYASVALTGEAVRFKNYSQALRRSYEVFAFCPASGQVATLFMDVTEQLQAQRAIQEADRRKTEFLAVLSHELRNPLAPIRNSLYVLERAEPGSVQAHRAKAVIDRQVAVLSRLVDDLLDVTRITRDKAELQRAYVDLFTIVRRTLDDHRSGFLNAGIELVVHPLTAALPIHADQTRLAQVVGNLLHNALKFTPRGGRVSVDCRIEAHKAEAILSIRDTGIGIAAENLPHLFEPFVQVRSAPDQHNNGLGLGLALVRGLVELHGGSVEASSPGLGQGTEFVVRLPLCASQLVPAAAPKQAGPQASLRVLIVDNNIDAAQTLAEALELLGHKVEVAYDAPIGLAKAKDFLPDVLLCDIGLPKMDSNAIARAFRAEPLLCHVLLVALSGYAQPEDVQRSRAAGFDHHLAKPTDLEMLQNLITRRRT